MTDEKTSTTNEAEALGVKKSSLKMAGFKHKDDSAKVAEEENRHKKLAEQRIVNRIAKAKAKAKMKPIGKRKAVILGRLRAVRAKKRANTYSNKIVEAWTEELDMIRNNPKQWIAVTNNGTIPFNPGNKRKKSAKEKLDGMDLDS